MTITLKLSQLERIDEVFTGIVEEIGEVTRLHEVSKEAIQLTIQAQKVVEDVQLGDSIAVNGICLTVTAFDKHSFNVDVMPETIKATSLTSVKEGSPVNLERSMQANDRFGGHFVTGHVDGVGEIVRKERIENAIYYDIELPNELMEFFIMKGSVAVDGVSLTVFGVNTDKNVLTISLIPHTVDVTILGEKGVGDLVNIEGDMLAKHVHNYLQLQNK